MNPTLTQIKAGMRALLEENFRIGDDGSYDQSDCEQAVKAVLTAAAEVGESMLTRKDLGWNIGDSITDNFVKGLVYHHRTLRTGGYR
jgi:hypothetical protein